MRDYLLFRLAGPLASWGAPVAGELRSSQDHPTRSALLGLIGAALGLDRVAQRDHDALSEQLHIAVAMVRSGHLITDYHTTQTPGGMRGRGLPTRRDELRHSSINTILSQRQYYCDQVVTVALWNKPGALEHHTLEELVSALTSPHWTLYLGRKSCPLSSPPEPQIMRAEHLADALHRTRFVSDAWLSITPGKRTHVYWDASATPNMIGIDVAMSAMRRDEPRHRTRWHFDNREESMGFLSLGSNSMRGEHHVPE